MRKRDQRVQVKARVAYRQAPSAGSWTVIDASGSGLCAVGDVEGLDLAQPIEVFIEDGSRSVHARLVNIWVRDSHGETAHGWRILGLVPDELSDLLALLDDAGDENWEDAPMARDGEE